MSTVLDLAIALTLTDMVTSGLGSIINDFKKLEGVTDDVQKKLNNFKNIGATGMAMFGAGAFGLDKTFEVIDDVANSAAVLEDAKTVLMNTAFGKNIIDPAYKEEVAEVEKYFEDLGMEIAANTTLDRTDIMESMTVLMKGGQEYQEVLNGTAEANAYFAEVMGVTSTSTADGTNNMVTGFRLVGDEIMQAMEIAKQYADATSADALPIQQSIGTIASTAMGIWKDRNNLDVAKEAVQLVATTVQFGKSEAESSTYARNFLSRVAATKTVTDKKQISVMKDAGWLDSEGNSIFIDHQKGTAKEAAELERILEETSQRMDAVDFMNLVKTVFQTQGANTALALADTELNLGQLEAKADMQLSIADELKIEMGTFNAVKDTFEESISNFKSVIGAPFLEPGKNIFKGLSEQVEKTTKYFKEHPEVTKYMFAIAGGISIFLMITGVILGVIAAAGSLKLVWSIAGKAIVGAVKPVLLVMSIVMIAILAFAGVAYVIYKNWDVLAPHFQKVFVKILVILEIVRQNFIKFASFLAPLIGGLFRIIEKGVVMIALFVLPLIDAALNFTIGLLEGGFKGAWESVTPLGRILLTAFAPALVLLGVYMMALTAKTLVNAAAFLVFKAATLAAAIASAVWRGIMIAAGVAQTIWNVAMGVGTAQTLLQKAAVLAFLPVIFAIKAAKLLWIGVQWALNVALAANPIGLVIILIAGLVAVVILVVTHFKQIVEWIGKAWDKLKGFLGFKSEAKEQLEAPIDMTITTNESKTENISVVPAVDGTKGTPDDILASLGLDSGTLSIPTELDMSGMMGGNADLLSSIPGMENGGLEIPANLDLANIDADLLSQIPGMDGSELNIPTNLDTSGMDNGLVEQMALLEDGMEIPITGNTASLEAQINGLGMSPEGVSMPVNIDTALLSEQMGSVESIINQSSVISEGIKVPVALGLDGIQEQLQGISALEGIGEDGVIISISADTSQIIFELDSLVNTLGLKGTEGGNSFANGLRSAQGAVSTTISAINGIILGGILSGNSLYQSGSNLIQGFISGMRSKFGALRAVANESASIVANYMKVMSPTKEGPLHTNHLWGGNLIKSFAEGMITSKDLLINASTLASRNISLVGEGAFNTSGMGFEDLQFNAKKEYALKFNPSSGLHNKVAESPVSISIYAAPNHDEKKIADNVVKILGKKSKEKDLLKSSLTNSPKGYKGGY